MVSWVRYSREFSEQYDLLKADLLEPGCRECCGGPTLKATDTNYPEAAPFRSEWGIVFSDGYYFRVYESFARMGAPNTGLGKRRHFSFHYGKASDKLDFDGFPEVRKPDTPVADLRIDLDRHNKPHIHLLSPDHIYQDEVCGYSIQDADMFSFLRAVIEHRRAAKTLPELLGIEVLPKKVKNG